MRTKKRWIVLFLLPAVVLFLLIYAIPLIMVFFTSLFDYRLTSNGMTFVGLNNYAQMFRDPAFRTSLLHTIVWIIIHCTLHVALGVSLALLAWTLFRLLSRNAPRRRAENAKFLKLIGPLQRWFHLRRTIYRDKEHCYFKCPHCGQQLRVPRGKGKITVTCRSCGASFEEKS